jgi:mannose-6-phosphate isomerase-like protein (cupin superfamily)
MLIKLHDAPTFDMDGTHVTGYAAPSRGASDTAVWRLRLEAATETPPHSLSREEVFIALAGAATAFIEDRRLEVVAGDALIVPAGVRFVLANGGAEPFEAVACLPVGATGTILPDGPTMVAPWAQ